jgi:hypothetical protein
MSHQQWLESLRIDNRIEQVNYDCDKDHKQGINRDCARPPTVSARSNNIFREADQTVKRNEECDQISNIITVIIAS